MNMEFKEALISIQSIMKQNNIHNGNKIRIINNITWMIVKHS